ncbi:hypothetical protein MKK65_26105 [Methylobacterium sp. J-001]|uniref:hypothetical protein n=1 Tax=Methylobacterium sp. J-001 TaxID=2836609 RepID=UPI001FB9DBF9|nr:hypothetical protein [Methylobacterium sp. J-001]MCJ2120004.1 hypothetical protein [Methylobacterium sp. J-001]
MIENSTNTADGRPRGDDDPAKVGHPTVPSCLAATPLETEDPARHVGEIFRRLVLAAETFPGQAFGRIVAAVLVALGKAVLVEAERQAERLRERAAPLRSGVRVSATARRVDFDGFDIAPAE